jgi:membrane fusion protein (multidrug efflux system)
MGCGQYLCREMRTQISRIARILLPVAGVLLLHGCKEKKQAPAAAGPKGPKVLHAEGIVVRPVVFQDNYTTTGTLLPNEEVSVMPEVSGRITSISFKEGAEVRQGQVLVQLYNEDLKAQLQKLRAQRELQVKIKGRQAALLEVGGISQQEYETTTTQIQSIEADIAYAEAQLRKTTISAPFSGRTGIRNVSVGAVVTPASVITTLQQTGQLKMDMNVPEQYRSELKPGKQLRFTVSGQADTFTATIAATEPTANAATRTLKVRAVTDNRNNKLGAGAFTHIVLPFENNDHALMVPSQAVIPTNREKMVAVVKNGKAVMTPVLLGARTSDKVQILQGLAAGDTVLVTGIMQVKPDMQVEVRVNE